MIAVCACSCYRKCYAADERHWHAQMEICLKEGVVMRLFPTLLACMVSAMLAGCVLPPDDYYYDGHRSTHYRPAPPPRPSSHQVRPARPKVQPAPYHPAPNRPNPPAYNRPAHSKVQHPAPGRNNPPAYHKPAPNKPNQPAVRPPEHRPQPNNAVRPAPRPPQNNGKPSAHRPPQPPKKDDLRHQRGMQQR